MSMNQPVMAEDFQNILNEPTREPGPPFYDATLNYLADQYTRTDVAIGKAGDKIDKLRAEVMMLQRELATIQALLIEEWRTRQPANPNTGEITEPPFQGSFE